MWNDTDIPLAYSITFRCYGVSIGLTTPDRALNDFKAYATRRMRRNYCWLSERSPWADKGSKRHLWNERSIELAVDYVMNRQGDDLPDFD